MRRVFVIFYLKNHENGTPTAVGVHSALARSNAVRRCLLYKNETFL